MLSLQVNDTKSVSTGSLEIGYIDFNSSNILLGSGSNHSLNGQIFTAQQTFTGSIDEFRLYGKIKSDTEIENSRYGIVYQDDDLQLSYRFNEASGSYTSNNILLDHSGNGLHATVANYATTMRSVRPFNIPLIFEPDVNCPILFPNNTDLQTYNTNLLTEANKYDINNPNLILKLIPKHYFDEAQFFEGFVNEQGDLGENYG